MKAGEDKVYIGYGICEGDSVAPCLDGPYSLLVNGTDTIKSVKGDEFDGYTQYVVYASLTKNDKIQVLNESCGALWMPAIEEGGASAHFKKGENDATIDSTGCFDLYIKMKAGEDKVYIGYGICEGDSVAPCLDGPYGFIVNGTDTLKAVALEEADAQGRKQYLIDSVALKANDKFVVANLSCDSKWVMDVEEYGAYANFTKGEDAYTVKVDGMYAFYIKMSLEAGDVMYIGEIKDEPQPQPCQDGPYGFIVNGTDTLKAVALEEADAQGRKQYLIDSVALKANDKFVVANLSCDSKWVMDVEEYGAYANFTKGEDAYTVKVDGMYAFYIKMSLEAGDVMYIGEIKDEPQPQPCQDGPYGFIVNGTDTLKAVALEEADAQGRKQYLIDSVALKANDKFVVANLSCDSKWVMDVEEYGAYANFTKGEDAYTVKVDGMYAFYIKMSLEAGDVMYIGEIKDEPAGGCDWDNLPWLGSALPAYVEQFKICLGDPKPGVVNIQESFGTEAGIYVTFPSAAFGQISLSEGQYAIQGAGMLLYVSAFTAKETEVSVVCENVEYVFTVYNDKGGEPVCKDKYGLKVGETVVEFAKNEAQTEWVEYYKQGVELTAGDVIVLYNICEDQTFAAKVAGYEGLTPLVGGDGWTVTETAKYDFYLKLIYGADELYVVKQGSGDTKFYMKNNWNAGADWTWKEMTKDGDNFKLENVVFGGSGVNYNTSETDEGAAWVEVADILGDKIAAKDTVTFTLDPVAATVTAKLIGKYQEGTEPENAYGLMINGTTFVKAELNPATANEYMALDVALTAGQTFQVFDKANNNGWVITNWNEGSYQFTIENDKYVVTETAKYDFYFKLDFGNDYIYVAKKETPSAIDNLVAPANELRKVMIDGKLYILRDGKVYSVQGQLIR